MQGLFHCYENALEKWHDYDPDVHCTGTYIMWDKRQIKSIAHSSSGMGKPIETELQNKSEIYFNDGEDVYLYNEDQKYLF